MLKFRLLKPKAFKLRTSLALVVVVLSLLTLVAAGIGWYSQQQTRMDVAVLVGTGIDANTNVKNAYVHALLAVNQIDAAIKVDNPQQRARELEAAEKLLGASRDRLNAFLDVDNLTGSNGNITKQILRETFSSYWGQALELKNLASTQDTVAYEALKRGQARNAARTIDSAFNRFDTYIQSENESAQDAMAARYQLTLYIFGAVIALALIIALMASLTMQRMVLTPLGRVGRYFDQMAAGDLTQNIRATSNNEIGVLYTGLQRMQSSLAQSVDAVRQGMMEISRDAHTIEAGNNDLSSRTEQQAAALQETAASLEQLASTVRLTADNAAQANQLAAGASEVMQKGSDIITQVVTSMQAISASSHKISDIVGVIDGIAFQTNILALNAAVEAARAGEEGRGFAVVAGEVRALAQRSATAAREIKELITDAVDKVATGSTQVGQAGQIMNDIVVNATQVGDIMAEISAATSEQSTGIDQINLAVSQMDKVTQENASLVTDAAETAAVLMDHVEKVGKAVAQFKTLNRHDSVNVESRPLVKTKAAAVITQPTLSMPAMVHSNQPVEKLPTSGTALTTKKKESSHNSTSAGSADTGFGAGLVLASSGPDISSNDDWEEF